MIRVNKMQKEQLEKAGLLRYPNYVNGVDVNNANIHITGREHVARDKSYYITEEPKIMIFLGLADKSQKGRSNSYRKNKKAEANQK